MKDRIFEIISKYNGDSYRLMDILHDIQAVAGYIDHATIALLADKLPLSAAQIEETVSFYHFYSDKPLAKFNIYLNDSVTANMNGRKEVLAAFEAACGIKQGQVTSDGTLGLFPTSCIGMNDQEPAAIINDKVFTRLTPFRVKQIVNGLKHGLSLDDLVVEECGDGKNALPEINSMVCNNIRRKGALLNHDYKLFSVINDILPNTSSDEIIDIVSESNIRGRGGAGFPTGLKWKFGSRAKGEHRYIICNADEGEPGTFKDRVLLTEYPEMVFEGMVTAGYAVGADMGLLYLRYEYKYLLSYLNGVLESMRKNNYLGKNISGIEDFDFDIRIQLGAGAYICGEESALIESLEGKRGEPRDKPPFPVEKGYMNLPTVVNNVETLATVVKIIKNGADWFNKLGNKDSVGTKVLSISGDCRFPGIYEVEWGLKIGDVLDMCGADNVQAIQVGGPSGALIGEKDFHRELSYSDLPTGGSMIVFNKNRNLLTEVVLNFMNFFIEESCGTCSTCRNMPYVLREKLLKVINGRGVKQDIEDMTSWARLLNVSRCGLGQTAANPIVSSIKNFRPLYEALLNHEVEYDSGFNLETSVLESCKVVGRQPIFHHNA
ncbi:MAG: NAD(P)H-dependent oxidoreductase subunit E [Bacteroidales bacterium]|nr:NAD(P)H-dependent oxidoreductase subunit E [Bacteroidales bacterium]